MEVGGGGGVGMRLYLYFIYICFYLNPCSNFKAHVICVYYDVIFNSLPLSSPGGLSVVSCQYLGGDIGMDE